MYLLGQFVSVAGNWMQNVAVAWVVLRLSDSGTLLGVVTAARFAPIVLLGQWGGLAADRWDRRRLLLVSQAFSGVVSIALGLLVWAGEISIVLLLVLMVLQGLLNVFAGPARQSMVSDLVPRANVGNAIAMNSIAMNTARMIGPALAGMLIATLGVAPCFFVNAVTFAVGAVSVLLMRTHEIVPSPRTARARGQIREGLRYVVGQPILFSTLMVITVTGVFTWEFQVTLPLLARDVFHGDASLYGSMLSLLGFGAVAGGFLAVRRTHVTTQSLAVSSMLWGSSIVAASVASDRSLVMALLVLVGIGSVSFSSQAKTLLQLSTAPHMRGRVMSLWSTAWQGTTLIGAPLMGWIGEHAGARVALATGGVAALLAGICYLAWGRSTHAIEAGTS